MRSQTVMLGVLGLSLIAAAISECLSSEQANSLVVPAAEVVQIFATNEALADQRFRDQAVPVRGTMIKIYRGGILLSPTGEKAVYYLEMAAGKHADEPQDRAAALLTFRFTEDDRQDLATLKAGAEVTVEGQAAGFTRESEGGKNVVHFLQARLVK